MSPRAPTVRRPIWQDGAVLAAAGLLALAHALHFGHTCDDAFISLRYARNLASGLGAVFNPGEYVMGYSDFLWVLLLAALERAGLGGVGGARVLGTLFAWGTLACVFVYLRRAWPERALAPIAAIGLLAANATFAMWMLGGLEGHLFAFLLTAGVTVAMATPRDAPRSRYTAIGALLGLAAITRPEGVFYAVPVGAWLLLQRPDREGLRCAGLVWGTAALFYLSLMGWALWYYGDPLPNTAYAKWHPVSGPLLRRGWEISLWFLRGYYGAPLLAIALWASTTRLSLRSPGWLPLSIVAAFAVFYLRIGGDALVYYRMWLWTLPMFALLAGEGIARLRGPRLLPAAVAMGLVALTLPNSFVGNERGRIARDEEFVRGAALIGEALGELPPDTLVAANNIGALGWTSGLPIVDMLGLTDRHIARAGRSQVGIPAHESHDGAYVLEREPDLIFYRMPRIYDARVDLQALLPSRYPSDVDLRRSRRFLRDYELDHIRLGDGRFAPVFRRKSSALPLTRGSGG